MTLAEPRRFLVFADGELVFKTDSAKDAVALAEKHKATRRVIYSRSAVLEPESQKARKAEIQPGGRS